jgi:hypothetical protein
LLASIREPDRPRQRVDRRVEAAVDDGDRHPSAADPALLDRVAVVVVAVGRGADRGCRVSRGARGVDEDPDDSGQGRELRAAAVRDADRDRVDQPEVFGDPGAEGFQLALELRAPGAGLLFGDADREVRPLRVRRADRLAQRLEIRPAAGQGQQQALGRRSGDRQRGGFLGAGRRGQERRE